MKYDDKIQLLIIGEPHVGKTSILVRYTTNNFYTNHLATLGIDYYTKDVNIDDKAFRVKIWDTAGQERYRSLAYSFFRNADGILLVYDVNNRQSFEDIKTWIQTINSNIVSHNLNIIKIVIGNRAVLNEEGEKFAKENNFSFYETSAKENINIDQSFMCIIKKVVECKYAEKNDNLKDTVILSKKKNSKG